MLVKQSFFGKSEIKLDYHKTRGFYNMLQSSALVKCKCGLCALLISLSDRCPECKNGVTSLGVDPSKPLELSCAQLDSTLMVSLVYQLDGRLFKPLSGQTYFKVHHICQNCKTEYFLEEDFSKSGTLLLKLHREINSSELNSPPDPSHLADITLF